MKAIASPAASRSAAAIAETGGRASSQIATPIRATVISAIEMECPVGPKPASTLPGSGLPAGVRIAVIPSGKRTTCSASASAWVRTDGRITAALTPTPISAVRAAGRRP